MTVLGVTSDSQTSWSVVVEVSGLAPTRIVASASPTSTSWDPPNPVSLAGSRRTMRTAVPP